MCEVLWRSDQLEIKLNDMRAPSEMIGALFQLVLEIKEF